MRPSPPARVRTSDSRRSDGQIQYGRGSWAPADPPGRAMFARPNPRGPAASSPGSLMSSPLGSQKYSQQYLPPLAPHLSQGTPTDAPVFYAEPFAAGRILHASGQRPQQRRSTKVWWGHGTVSLTPPNDPSATHAVIHLTPIIEYISTHRNIHFAPEL